MLPVEKIINYNLSHLPTDWQAVIFRNYGLIPICRIAKALKTTNEVVENEANRLGINKILYNKNYLTNGYITIIKNNWHICSYNQLLILLDWTKEYLDFILKEDDFLEVKLGWFKPKVKEPLYKSLTNKQIEETNKIRQILEKEFICPISQPFDFYNNNNIITKNEKECSIEERIIYSYSALYGDCLLDGIDNSYPDILLKKLSDLNINGIWMQAVLSKLCYYPYDEKLCKGYKERQNNLNKLIEKCKKYGIKIYLYINEPRSLPTKTIENLKLPKGQTEGEYSAICSHSKVAHDYLYNSVSELVNSCPNLGGLITITMSENLTNCFSHKNVNCSCCKNLNAEDEVPEINNIIIKAIKDNNSKIRLIANLWQWDSFIDKTPETADKIFSKLDKDIEIMCISENAMKINKGGTENTIIDYSISNVGPSKKTIRHLSTAKKYGHKILAKIQVNNSWECCCVPYIPVFDLIHEHMTNLQKLSINGVMLSWTLGSYPSINLNLVKQFYKGEEVSLKNWYKKTFINNAEEIEKAVKYFSQAFKEFPFDLNFLYYGPQNLGCGNLWQFEKSGLKPTMVAFPYDDYNIWKGKYDLNIFKSQIEKLCNEWEKGITILNRIENNSDNINEIKIMAEACYIQFKSTLLQLKFSLLKEEQKDCKIEKLSLIKEELQLTKKMYNIISKDCRIGFEPSNHYYFNANSLLEKIINLNNMIDILNNKQ